MKKIQSKMKGLESLHDLPHYKSMGIFFKRSRAAHVRDFTAVLFTCKYEEDPIKKEGARLLTRLCRFLFRRSREGNSEVSFEFC